MITARVRFGPGVTAIEVEGHEGGVEGGRVCAAVTAITQTAVAGLQLYAAAHPDLVSVVITEEESPSCPS